MCPLVAGGNTSETTRGDVKVAPGHGWEKTQVRGYAVMPEGHPRLLAQGLPHPRIETLPSALDVCHVHGLPLGCVAKKGQNVPVRENQSSLMPERRGGIGEQTLHVGEGEALRARPIPAPCGQLVGALLPAGQQTRRQCVVLRRCP